MNLRARSDLARIVDGLRDRISCEMVERALVSFERTLALDVVADAYVDELAFALEFDRPDHVLEWSRATVHRYRASRAVPAMLRAGPQAAREVLRRHGFVDESALDRLSELDARSTVLAVAAEPPQAAAALPTLGPEDAVVDELLARMDLVDPFTSEHSRAVGAWCFRIGQRLSFSDADAAFVARCGLLHDVGKICTPVDVLLAPRALTIAEWSVMREHPRAGERIALDLPVLREIAPIVRAHHERLDGRGYPDGVEDRSIPLAVRIVSVADSFNAMIGRRPYRKPMTPQAAIAELRAHGGTQFDPLIVEAMIDVIVDDLSPAPVTRAPQRPPRMLGGRRKSDRTA